MKALKTKKQPKLKVLKTKAFIQKVSPVERIAQPRKVKVAEVLAPDLNLFAISDHPPEAQDIIKVILNDHLPLKKLIKILKNQEKTFEVRQKAFEEFSALLLTHAKSEEQSLYFFMKNQGILAKEAFEGEIEHGIAEQVLEASQLIQNEEVWSAKIKVLAELVENHIKQEETKMLPVFKRKSKLQARKNLGQQYLELKSHYHLPFQTLIETNYFEIRQGA